MEQRGFYERYLSLLLLRFFFERNLIFSREFQRNAKLDEIFFQSELNFFFVILLSFIRLFFLSLERDEWSGWSSPITLW